MLIEIKDVRDGKVIYSGDHENIKTAVERAARKDSLSWADLKGADLRKIRLDEADLSFAQLTGANLNGAIIINTDFTGANLTEASVADARIDHCTFALTNLFRADFSWSRLEMCPFKTCNFSNAFFCNSYFYGGTLVGARFLYTDMRWCTLDKTHIYGSFFDCAKVKGLILENETLKIAPLQICSAKRYVLITDNYMKIGCERHSHEEWAYFDDARISRMSEEALEQWETYRFMLLGLCAAHSAEAAKVE